MFCINREVVGVGPSYVSSVSPGSTSSPPLPTFEKKRAIRERFQAIVRKMRPLSRGALIPNALIVQGKNWIENLGIRLLFPGKTVEGHFHRSCFKEYRQQWDESVLLRALYSFEEYMNSIVIPKLDDAEKEELLRTCKHDVEYYTQAELSHLQVHFVDGVLHTASSICNDWLKRQTVEKEQEKPAFDKGMTFRMFCNDKKGSFRPGLQPIKNDSEVLIYVLTAEKKLYIQRKQRRVAHHSSFTHGTAVLAAGELKVSAEGRLISLNTLSGHYRPGAPQLATMLDFLQSNGVQIDGIDCSYGCDKKPVLYPSTWLKAVKAGESI